MIERNIGSAALIGGNAKLGGSAFGKAAESGNVLFDGAADSVRHAGVPAGRVRKVVNHGKNA